MKNINAIPLETKSVETKALGSNLGNDGDVSEAFDEFMTAFSAFREANDERLKKVEKVLMSMCFCARRLIASTGLSTSRNRRLINMC